MHCSTSDATLQSVVYAAPTDNALLVVLQGADQSHPSDVTVLKDVEEQQQPAAV